MFNWVTATVNECAWHIARTPPQNTTSVYTYHEKKGNIVVLTKISEARKLARQYRTLIKAEMITEQLLEKGIQGADNTTISCKSLG